MITRIREGSFVVFGLGTFGSHCARALYRSGAIVLAVDREERLVEQISPDVTVAVRAEALDEDALHEVGAFDMTTAIVALRRHFDTAVLLTHMLRNRGIQEVLVQVDSDREANAIQAVGATGVIFPERDMAEEIARKLITPSLADQIPLDQNYAIIDVQCPSSFVGSTLQELDLRKKHNVTVVALRSNGAGAPGMLHPAPPPDLPLNANHHLLLLGDRKTLFKFKETHNLE